MGEHYAVAGLGKQSHLISCVWLDHLSKHRCILEKLHTTRAYLVVDTNRRRSMRRRRRTDCTIFSSETVLVVAPVA